MHAKDEIVGHWDDYAHARRRSLLRRGKEIADERYLLLADLSPKATPTI